MKIRNTNNYLSIEIAELEKREEFIVIVIDGKDTF